MRNEFKTLLGLEIEGDRLEAIAESDVNVEEEELDIHDLSLEDLIALAKDVAEAIEERESEIEMEEALMDLLEDGIVTIFWTDTDGQMQKGVVHIVQR